MSRVCQGETPEPSLQPRSRGWSWPLAGQGPDWTVPHLYAPCYTARYLMFCQSSQTKTFAAVLAHQISHRNNRLLPSQSPMVPRCALPPRPMPSLGDPAALLIGPLAYKSHGSRLWGWAGKTIAASSSPSSSSSIASPLLGRLARYLPLGGQVAEILKAHQYRSRRVLIRVLHNGSSSGGLWDGLRYKLFEAAVAVA